MEGPKEGATTRGELLGELRLQPTASPDVLGWREAFSDLPAQLPAETAAQVTPASTMLSRTGQATNSEKQCTSVISSH